MEEIKAIRITDKKSGKTYILDFSRETVKDAMKQKFDVDEVFKFPTVAIPQLFYHSLRKEQKKMSPHAADELFETLFPNGMPANVLGRLYDLYTQAATAQVLADEEEETKNVDVLIEM